MSITLFPHQEGFLKRNPARHLLAFETGLGKTRTAIEWVKLNNLQRVMIVCPKTIKSQWIEIANKELKPLGIGGKVLTKEQFRDKEPIRDAYQFKGFIFDEAHYVASDTSKLFKKTIAWLESSNANYRLLLTATPVLAKGSINVFALATVLGWSINKTEWRETFQRLVSRPYLHGRMAWEERTDKATKDRLQRFLGRIGTFVSHDEVFDIPEQKVIKHRLLRPASFEDKLLRHLDGVTSDIACWTAEHVLEQEYKRDFVLDLVTKYRRVILVSRYLEETSFYFNALKEKRENVVSLTSATKNRGEMLAEIKNADSYVLTVSSSISEGYNLPHTQAIIYASLDFSVKNKVQMDGRALRMDYPSPTNIHIVLMKGGADEAVYRTISRREDFHTDTYLKNKKAGILDASSTN